jgi:hypothetical protein
MWRGAFNPPSPEYLAKAFADPLTATNPDVNLLFFAPDAPAVPVWLTGVYLAANVVLNALNWYWFVKMVGAVRKRFEPPKPGAKERVAAVVAPTAEKATAVEDKEGVAAVRQRRAHSIVEDVVPDSEELREGTIQ